MKNTTKNILLKHTTILFPVFVFAILILGVENVSAQALLEPLGGGSSGGTVTDPGGYIKNLYGIGVSLAGILAVIMIIVGGVEYITSAANPSGRADANKRIWAAIGGLLIALLSYIILNTINPNLVRFGVSIDGTGAVQTQITGGSVGSSVPPITPSPGPGGPPPGDELSEQRARGILGIGDSVSVSNPPCVGAQTTGCTNVAGLPLNTVNHVRQLSMACGDNCSVVITGGTENGHQTHAVGIPIIDLRKNIGLDDFIIKNASSVETTSLGKKYTVDGVTFLDENNHWHTVFPNTSDILFLKRLPTSQPPVITPLY